MEDKTKEEEAVQQIYAYAIELKKEGKTDEEIRQDLIKQGLDEETATAIIDNLNQAIEERQEEEGSKFPTWIIYIGILIFVNILSAIFDWPFWIY